MANDTSSLEITTNIGCNVACIYCPQKIITKTYSAKVDITKLQFMSFDIFSACLSTVPRSVKIIFSGFSEPWLNKDCARMIKYAHERGHKISIYTTLVGSKIEDLASIVNIPYDMFMVHLPDDNPKMTKIPSDINHIERIKFIQSSKIRNLHFMCVGKPIEGIVNIIKTSIDERTIINRAENVSGKQWYAVKNSLSHSMFRIKITKANDLICGRTMSNILDQNVLLPNGDVVLCCMDYGMRHVLGNLNKISYVDLFKSTEFLLVQKSLKNIESSSILCKTCSEAMPNKTHLIVRKKVLNAIKSWTYRYLRSIHVSLKRYIALYQKHPTN